MEGYRQRSYRKCRTDFKGLSERDATVNPMTVSQNEPAESTLPTDRFMASSAYGAAGLNTPVTFLLLTLSPQYEIANPRNPRSNLSIQVLGFFIEDVEEFRRDDRQLETKILSLTTFGTSVAVA